MRFLQGFAERCGADILVCRFRRPAGRRVQYRSRASGHYFPGQYGTGFPGAAGGLKPVVGLLGIEGEHHALRMQFRQPDQAGVRQRYRLVAIAVQQGTQVGMVFLYLQSHADHASSTSDFSNPLP
jgi:hypothetical protein